MNPPSPALPRVVADTNLFVAAGFAPASDSAHIFEAARAGALRLVWHVATRRETEHAVAKIPPLRGTDPSAYFRSDTRYDGPTDLHTFDSIPDPADRKFAALAAATGTVLVTSDRHLLGGRPHPGVRILTPAEFVRQYLRRENVGESESGPPVS